jgi:hypothetical protein
MRRPGECDGPRELANEDQEAAGKFHDGADPKEGKRGAAARLPAGPEAEQFLCSIKIRAVTIRRTARACGL